MEKSKEEIKADELIDFYESVLIHNYDIINKRIDAIRCAIKCVEEIKESRPTAPIIKNNEDYALTYFELVGKNRDFWQKVKQILIDKQK